MHWDDTPLRKAVDFGAAFGVPDNPKQYRVCILRVPESDPLPPAFIEFWRRALSEGVEGSSERWEAMLFSMNLLGGGFTLVFTNRELNQHEPPVFKLSAESLETECYELPSREPGDPRSEFEYAALEDKCLDLLRDAMSSEPIAGQIQRLRCKRDFSMLVCDFYREKKSVRELFQQ